MLRNWLLGIFLCLTGTAMALTHVDDGLPYEPDTTLISAKDIGLGDKLRLDFQLKIPSVQKLNQGAESFVAVYERHAGEKWVLTEKMDFKEVATFTNEMNFLKTVNLKYSDSEVALFSTVIHCGKTHKTGCYIQGFKSVLHRNKNTALNTVPFHIEVRLK